MNARRPDPRQRRRPRRRAARHVRRPPARRSTATGRRRSCHTDDGDDVWVFEAPGHPQHRAQRRRRPAPGGVRRRADAPSTRCGPAATTSHERVKDMNADGVLGSMCFPSLPGVLPAACSPAPTTRTSPSRVAPGLQRLAHRRVVRRLPGPLHPDGHPADLGPRAHAPTRSAASRRRAATRSPSPRTPRRSAARASTATTGTRSGRRCVDTGTWSCPSTSARRASWSITAPDAPIDVMITLQPMNIVPGGGRPAVVAGAQGVPRPADRPLRGRHRLDPVLPRARRLHLRACTTPGPARTSATSCRARCSASTSSPASSPTRSGVELRHDIGIDNICWECDYPHSDSTWPNAPEELGRARADGVPDDEIDKITHENAMRWYSFDPFAHRPRGAVHRRRAAGRGAPATTCPRSPTTQGRYEPTVGIALGDMVKRVKQ